MNDVISRDYWPKEWPDWPEDPKVRKVVGGLYEIGLFILKAPASCRKFRLEQAEKRAQKYLSQMTEKEREQAGALVHLWERNALIQQRIRYEENKNGIDAANHLYPEWRSAGDQMDRAEKEASQLGLAANEYFRSRMERFDMLTLCKRFEVSRHRAKKWLTHRNLAVAGIVIGIISIVIGIVGIVLTIMFGVDGLIF
jgi:hypothetical protein